MPTIRLKHDLSDEQFKELQRYMDEMPIEYILAGLRFSYRRWLAKERGMLMVGRRSKVRQEVEMLTLEQARWRLENWSRMIKIYREKGYSYPTIHRIRKALMRIVNSYNKN
ncbi:MULTISPECIES: hypothetical protein [Candidatus Nitrosocaldus]|jgi:hypothetical protein|uniref:Uncharacterized protein n=1 Tax=Candidatus Nitrosocaldus cavascurensis TaxID=2058097 RepID=A0A2K5AQS7_9ARCH|nr:MULTISPECIES: hypothetical protein [Candidatus Nitrosocaldus]GBC74280.1 hypothetical protein HRbin05_00317 [archaeon HR05]SPC33985.1 conserved protein of unknown function [Candidatus Nitrosocaldus cavascurensis]